MQIPELWFDRPEADALRLILQQEVEFYVEIRQRYEVLKSQIIDLSDPNLPPQITSINTSSFDGSPGPEIAMTIPLELLRAFDENNGEIRIISALYRNVSAIFSADVRRTNSSLGSDIVASSLQCGNRSCSTSNYTLTTSNVTITFEHSTITKEILKTGNVEALCVFLSLPGNRSLTPTTILNIGNWSTRGCTLNVSLSSDSRTVCDCNHLTHFAILLSPRPPEFNKPITLSLSIIGYIGVSVSLVAMAITVFTFTFLKSLRSMRNYIHINLCISLSIAQIIFVAGVDKTGPPGGDVPVHCQVIAIFLHYFFLVSFMWMLMEGVVLYVALVRVFVKHTKRYILAFTLSSYGVPLIYVGLLAVPLGYKLPGEPHYGYERACFLDFSTNFVWAFISPFVLIILANIGFFIMAAKIMWRHQMKVTDTKKISNIRNWLKSAISLVVIMCFTWIMGVFIIREDKLAPLAYIYVILVAFQGLFIFLIFVVFSKAVREAYSNWWKVTVNESDFLSKYFSEQLNFSKSSNKLNNKKLRKKQQKLISNTSLTDNSNQEKKMSHIELEASADALVLSNTHCSMNSDSTGSFNLSSETSNNFDAVYSLADNDCG